VGYARVHVYVDKPTQQQNMGYIFVAMTGRIRDVYNNFWLCNDRAIALLDSVNA
jgi:hypothetical protein